MMAPSLPVTAATSAGQTAHAGGVAVEQFGMKAQRREGAMRETQGLEICLGMGAADGAAAPPQAAGRFGGVVAVPLVRARRSRQCEEGAGLIERGAQRRRIGAVADKIEQIAMLSCRGVGPFSRNARAGKADE